MLFNTNTWLRGFVKSFCRVSFDKTGSGQRQTTNKSQDEKQAEEQGVFCAGCQEYLCGRDQAIEMAGGHRHAFVNPAGVEFEIAIYREIACRRQGPLTLAYTWFAGFAWQLVLCPGCRRHLGWRYHQPDSPDFYGLITDRIHEK